MKVRSPCIATVNNDLADNLSNLKICSILQHCKPLKVSWQKYQESLKIAEYPRYQLIHLEINTCSFKSQRQCQNPCSRLLYCHCKAILYLNLTLNKMKYAKSC